MPASRRWNPPRDRGRLVFLVPAAVKTGLTILAFGLVFAQPATTAAQKLEPGIHRKLKTSDDWPLHITYYESPAGRESPAVILLHMRDSNRLVWKGGFARQLQKAGYAAVAVDLRKHGESKPPGAVKSKRAKVRLTATDYIRMVTIDLETVKQFLLEEHHKEKLNIRKTAIIAPGMCAPLALTFALRDWLKRPYIDAPSAKDYTPKGQDIRAIILLSPEKNVPRINSTKALLALRNPEWEIAFMIGYGASNEQDGGGKVAKEMFKRLTAREENRKRVYPPEGYATTKRGTDMLTGRLGVERHIESFLRVHLKELPDKWRDRHSRLDD